MKFVSVNHQQYCFNKHYQLIISIFIHRLFLDTKKNIKRSPKLGMDPCGKVWNRPHFSSGHLTIDY